jgi:hypothetical protein
MKFHQQFRRYVLTDEQKDVLAQCINGELSVYKAAAVLKCSHQQTINMGFSIIRQLAQNKKIDARKLLSHY